MIRTQIQLTRMQAEALNGLAREREVSIAELVRQAVDLFLQQVNKEEQIRRALSVMGRFSSGLGDVSERHDDYLAEDFLK